MAILVDASFICAYANSRDVHHSAARNAMRDVASGKYGRVIITDFIFDETVTVVKRKVGRDKAVETGIFLLSSQLQMALVNGHVFERAWELFRDSDELSFTDCTSIAFMLAFGIGRIATFDKAFSSVSGIDVVDS